MKNNGPIGAMGRVGARGDNAAMGSFFALLHKNVLDRKRCASREELRLVIITWIEKAYPAVVGNAAWDDSPRSNTRH